MVLAPDLRATSAMEDLSPVAKVPLRAAVNSMGLAGINMLIFEFITVRDVQKWDLNPTPPLPARIAGGISFTCWVLVFIFGRWAGFAVLPE